MKNLTKRMSAFIRSEDGPTATEYAVMSALNTVACIAAVKSLGTKSAAAFKSTSDVMP